MDYETELLKELGVNIIDRLGEADIAIADALALLCSLSGTLIRSYATNDASREAMITTAQNSIARSARGRDTPVQ